MSLTIAHVLTLALLLGGPLVILHHLLTEWWRTRQNTAEFHRWWNEQIEDGWPEDED